MTYIKLEDCTPGGVYRLKSRNLAFGVFDGETGFMGIREKFYDRFLFTEYHYDAGMGTARPLEKIGAVPEGTSLAQGQSLCRTCMQKADFDMTRGETADERWQHLDGPKDHPAETAFFQNQEIFQILEKYETSEALLEIEEGSIWKGNGNHGFFLMDSSNFKEMKDWEEVDADDYFQAQINADICPGVHHFFCKGSICGRIAQDRNFRAAVDLHAPQRPY